MTGGVRTYLSYIFRKTWSSLISVWSFFKSCSLSFLEEKIVKRKGGKGVKGENDNGENGKGVQG